MRPGGRRHQTRKRLRHAGFLHFRAKWDSPPQNPENQPRNLPAFHRAPRRTVSFEVARADSANAAPPSELMDYRRLGHSGLRVPVLSFGTATFGGSNDFFKAWGATDAGGAARLIDVCLDHGISMFDSADVYSDGLAESILGQAIKGKRGRLLISTKATFPRGDGPNDYGSSRRHLTEAVDGSLKRLGVDHIDLFQRHGQDYNTPVEETLAVLDGSVRAGKIRYIGCSNFSGWHLMKSLASSSATALSATSRTRPIIRC